MLRQMLKSKIHRATVTDANVNYEGSVTIDEQLMVEANIIEYEKVLLANITTGSRLETYAITGKWGSGIICANGAAALHNKVGDKILIMSFCALPDKDAKRLRPKLVIVDEKNRQIRKK